MDGRIDRPERLDRKLRGARFHILLAMRYLAISAPLPRMNAHEMERYCEVIKKALWSSNVDDLCARAASIVERVANGNFHNDNVRTQPFTDGVIERCQKEISTPRKKPRIGATR
jgi:hypothetical protein